MVEAKLRSVTSAAAAGKNAAATAAVDGASVDDCIALLDVCANYNPIEDAKLVLQQMAKTRVKSLKIQEVENLCKAAMEKLAPRKQQLKNEEGEFRRQVVAEVYDARDDFFEAIQVLKQIEYEGDCFEEKIDDWLNIATY